MNDAGIISGVPTAPGEYSFRVAVDNGLPPGLFSNRDQRIIILESPQIFGQPTVGQVGLGYSFAYTVSGTPVPVEAVTAGSLPPGLTVSDAGVLSGTPTQPGAYAFSVTATNGVGSPATLASVMTVGLQPTLAGSAQAAVVGVPFRYAVTVAGSPTPRVVHVGGELPPGLLLADDGTVSGVPTAAGTYTARLAATNGFEPDATLELVMTVTAPAITVQPTPNAGGVGGSVLGPQMGAGMPGLATGAGSSSLIWIVIAGSMTFGCRLVLAAYARRRRA